MSTKAEMEKDLMINLHNLSSFEQNEFKILIAIYTTLYENLKKDKINDFKNSIESQIKFYSGKLSDYSDKISQVVSKYELLINKILIEYNTRFIALMNEIQNTESNQKIAITNMKLSIELKSEKKYNAVNVKRNNYEIVLQECFNQLENCKYELKNKLNEIFYNRNNQLAIKKNNIFQKIINLFTGKQNIDKFVFDAVDMEIKKLEETVENEIYKINIETIQNVAIIKNAQMQTQNIFNQMLRG